MKYKEITANTNMISLGNTGLRAGNPFEVQINFLNAIYDWREKDKSSWDTKPGGGQEKFLEFMQKNNIWKNEIKLDNKVEPLKDIRLKTAFLADIGLVTEDRFPTESGVKIRELMNSTNSINQWQIGEINFEWFKQMFKFDLRFGKNYENFRICPIRSLIYCCLEFDNELPYEFLEVFWSTSCTKEELENHIKSYKKSKKNNDSELNIFESLALRRQNSSQLANAKNNIDLYTAQYEISDNDHFKNFIKDRYLIAHGKGGDYFIKNGTYSLLLHFLEYWENKNNWSKARKKKFIYENIQNKQNAIKASLKSKAYKMFLFKSDKLTKNSKEWDRFIKSFENTKIINSHSKEDLLLNFHIFFSILTDLVNIGEYKDMNFRHLKLADIFFIDYESVKLKLQFKYLFERVKDKLLIDYTPKDRNKYRKFLETSHQDLSKIYEFLDIKYEDIYKDIIMDIPEVARMGLINYEEKEKLLRFENLVENKFNLEKVLMLLQLIDNDDKKKIKTILKEDFSDEYLGTIPALFEYLLGIAFYWISDKKVKLEDVLAMGLDNNLLPRTHVGGGREDIRGIKTSSSHFVIEATLSESDSQRQMEAEPVPRHVARYIQSNKQEKTIAIFVARKLDYNNLVILRNYKFSPWYDSNGEIVTKSMDILPLTIKNIIFILENNINLEHIENLIDELISSDEKDGKVWYENEVAERFTY